MDSRVTSDEDQDSHENTDVSMSAENSIHEYNKVYEPAPTCTKFSNSREPVKEQQVPKVSDQLVNPDNLDIYIKSRGFTDRVKNKINTVEGSFQNIVPSTMEAQVKAERFESDESSGGGYKGVGPIVLVYLSEDDDDDDDDDDVD